MGLQDSNPYSSGIMRAVRGAQELFGSLNKTPISGDQSVTPADEYESTFSEEKIASLTREWKKDWEGYYADIKATQDTAFDYWLGKQKTDAVSQIENVNVIDNRIFPALETFLPIATRANPDPLVSADTSPEGQLLADAVKKTLIYQADKQKLRMKLKSTTRNWAILRLGVVEVSYDYEIDDIKTTVINSKRILLDPKGSIDEAALFTGDWIGIRYEYSASKLFILFPDKKETIRAISKGKKGTKLEIIKWWYRGTDVFFTLDNLVLAKKKNPHWNYDGKVKRKDPETGVEIEEDVVGQNHLPRPTTPLAFLGVFKSGVQPHDDTSLILQNIGIQDGINKRYRQLDVNIDAQNNGIVVDGNKMTQEQAAEAASAFRRGAAIRVMGNPSEVFARPQIPELPPDVWQSLKDQREQLADIFGTSGSTPQGLANEDTARGKILVNQMDSSRIGGGVTEYIEQLADTIYNLWVQMMIVHYDNEHYVSALGMEEGQDMIALKNTMFTKSLVITVKDGSMIPKDPLTQRNEAMDLWSADAIDPLSLYQKLDFPDPSGAAERLLLWQMVQKGALPPQAYLPNFPVPQQTALPQAGVGGQAVNPVGPQTPPPAPQPDTQGAVEQQGKQLLESVPIH